MRLHCLSLWKHNIQQPAKDVDMEGVPVDVNLHFVRPTVPQFQITTMPPAHAISRTNWTLFVIDVMSTATNAMEMWIGLDHTSQSSWISAGPTVQAVRSTMANVVFKLRPLHLGRLTYPSFELKARDQKDVVNIVATNLVDQLPRHAHVVVVA